MEKIKSAASILLDALFPRRCPVCGDIVIPKGDSICPSCHKLLSYIKSPVCLKCGKEVMNPAIEYCFDCSRHPRSFEYGIAMLNYNEAAAHSMAAVKYKNKREYLDFYAEEAAERCGPQLLSMQADCLVPVPVHPSRLKSRGFNQAQVLAEKLGKLLELPVCADLLKRNKKTEPQKELNPRERLRNLEEAFTVEEPQLEEEITRVILVDDIYTTGSTIEACARALGQAGIKKVYFFTVCIGQGQ